MSYYVIDENNNKVEALDKEGVLALLEQAIREGTLSNIVKDSGFISKIKCCVSGETNKIAFINQAKYNELKEAGELLPNTWYYITDDTTIEDIDSSLEGIYGDIASHTSFLRTLSNDIRAHTRAINALKERFGAWSDLIEVQSEATLPTLPLVIGETYHLEVFITDNSFDYYSCVVNAIFSYEFVDETHSRETIFNFSNIPEATIGIVVRYNGNAAVYVNNSVQYPMYIRYRKVN